MILIMYYALELSKIFIAIPCRCIQHQQHLSPLPKKLTVLGLPLYHLSPRHIVKPSNLNTTLIGNKRWWRKLNLSWRMRCGHLKHFPPAALLWKISGYIRSKWNMMASLNVLKLGSLLRVSLKLMGWTTPKLSPPLLGQRAFALFCP